MSKDIDVKAGLKQVKKLLIVGGHHGVFIVIMIILVVYAFVVLRISQLAGAEPSNADSAAAAAQIPKIDNKAIEQIQTLEQSNTQIKSFFNSARSNPFAE